MSTAFIPLFLILILIPTSTLQSYTFQNFLIPTVISPYFIWDVYTEDVNDLSDQVSEWSVTGLINSTASKISVCGSHHFLGGIGVFQNTASMQKTYTNLPTHNIIYYSFGTTFIDNWLTTDSVTISFDGHLVFIFRPTPVLVNYASNICGSTLYPDMQRPIFGRVYHTASTVTLNITINTASGNAYPPSFGIKDVQIMPRMADLNDASETSYYLINDGTIPGGYGCNANNYPTGSGTTCSACVTGCTACDGNTVNDCYVVVWQYSYTNSAGLVSCPTNCALCTAHTSGSCVVCSSPTILDHDGTCVASCSNPNDIVKMNPSGVVVMCLSPCSGSNYMYWNYTCLPTCNAPLVQVNQGAQGIYCEYPCISGQYLDTNGNCLTSCSLTIRNENGYLFCDECPQGYYLYANGSCESTCMQYYTVSKAGSTTYCNFPCASGQNLYPNGSCSSSCPSPFVSVNSNCIYPCPAQSYYYAAADTCIGSCSYPYVLVDSFQCLPALSSTQQTVANGLSTTAFILRQICYAMSVLNAFISFNYPIPLFIMTMVNMIWYIKYINVIYSPMTQAIFDSLGGSYTNFGLFPAQLRLIRSKNIEQPIPYSFEKYGLSSSFLINYWDPLIIFLIIGTILLFVIAGKLLTKKKLPKLNSFFSKLKTNLIWNFCFVYFLTFYDQIVVYTSLDALTNKLSLTLPRVSFSMYFIMNFTALAVPIIALYKILKNHKSKFAKIQAEEKQLNIKDEGFEVLTEPYRDRSLLQQFFYPIFIFRIYLFYLIIAYLYINPIAQSSLTVCLNIMMLFYLVFGQQFKQKYEKILYIGQEVILLITNICVLILSLLNVTQPSVINGIGMVIIVFLLSYTILCIPVISTILFINIRETIRKPKVVPKLNGKPADITPPLVSREISDLKRAPTQAENDNSPNNLDDAASGTTSSPNVDSPNPKAKEQERPSLLVNANVTGRDFKEESPLLNVRKRRTLMRG